MYISNIIDELLDNGCYEVEPGVYLWTQETIIDEQEDWDDEDPCKNFDFTKSSFWLTAVPSLTEPQAYDSFAEYIAENY